MEQHLRIALWMVFFIGHLQAKPHTSATAQQHAKPQETRLCLNKADLSLHLLGTHVTCDPSVNYTSPSNVPKHCYGAALKCFADGLHKLRNCTGQLWRIGHTAEALERATELPEAHVDSSDCQWESSQTFAEFVKDFKTFAEQVNSGGC